MPVSLRAVVVAVEEYDAGDPWALDGPAMDAVRVVTWLRRSGVPDEGITLLVSALPHNRAAVEALGLPVRRPTRAVLYDLFTREIAGDGAAELFVHWGGHGALDDVHHHRLFCADATTADKRNVDFDALRRFLAGVDVRGLRRQVFLVDACQVLASERGYVNRLPVDGWPESPRRSDREQFSLFAAGVGEVADSLTVPRAGLFTAEVLADLTGAGLPATGLDVAALAERIDRRFTELRLAGRARQTPVYVWLKTPVREGNVYATPRTDRRMPIAALRDIVAVMLAAEEVASTPRRERMIMTMPDEIRSAVAYSSTPREHVIDWVRTCERFRTGRAALEGVLDLSMSDRAAFQRIVDAFDRHWSP
ncbi:hypothetical protein ACWT_3393 [Actinoplanes sp. SE50]|uniref:effector-associated domain 2-containing protein n=1 Tax=unclassified Actinoplanes TaxID=2626549 RepID=UPI00023ED23A|nr:MULTISPECIES: caspase family protein [unclassified Actinoplanes]AEV84416.1 hypothetical protein ACPL_3521 [Actinoplanes sp. SE50/110]ATO82808.1 hypothetical protein ACWT_3393 [Actinoplanes sp. SE50]SLM00216.1 hypothetical protein ACSP50_3448 [Actinoplanes sp. SE50/110]